MVCFIHAGLKDKFSCTNLRNKVNKQREKSNKRNLNYLPLDMRSNLNCKSELTILHATRTLKYKRPHGNPKKKVLSASN